MPNSEEESCSGDSVPTQPPEKKTGIHRIIGISRYSALPKLVGVTAYVLQFLNHLSEREPNHVEALSAKERHHALQEWIRTYQALTYSDEIANLSSHSQSRLPLVRQLRLFLDSGGLLRCLLPPNAKHPLSKLIIHDAHVKQLHSGVIATVTALRQNFWITSIRQHRRKQLKHCVTCRKLGEQPIEPQILLLYPN